MLEVEVFQIPGGRRVDRFDKTTLIVGRSAKCDIVVRDPDVSRRHLRIELIDGELWAEDMGSSNGSTVEGEPLAQRSRFGQGECLRVCDHEIRIRVVDASELSSPDHASSVSSSPVSSRRQPPPRPPSASYVPGNSSAPFATTTHPPQRLSELPQEVTPSMGQQPRRQHATPQAAPRAPVVAPAPGRIEMDAEGPSTARTFECKEALWQSYEQMAEETGIPVDELVNEALAFYGRQRVYANAGSAAHPQTSLAFVRRPPSILELVALPKR